MTQNYEEALKAFEDKKRRTTQVFIPAGAKLTVIDEFGEVLMKIKASKRGTELEVLDVMEVDFAYTDSVSTITVTVQTIPYEE